MVKDVPVAYKGEQPYIFISYAHKDSDVVLPIVAKLQQDGYRVWYEFLGTPSQGKYFHSEIRSRFNDLGFRVQ